MEAIVEQMILQFFQTKSNSELKQIETPRDIKRILDEEEDAVYDIKDRLWVLVQERIRWYSIAESIKDMVRHTYDSDHEEETEDEQED